MTVGHEFSGEVVQIGSGVTDVAVGDLVSGEGTWSAADVATVSWSPPSLHSHSSHRRSPRRRLRRIRRAALRQRLGAPRPDRAGVAAIFDPFGNAVHTALAFPMLGEDVLVTEPDRSASWRPVSKHAGARHVVITDHSDERPLARLLGSLER